MLQIHPLLQIYPCYFKTGFVVQDHILYYHLYLTNPLMSRNLGKTENTVLDLTASWISCCLCLNVNFIFSKTWSFSAQWFIKDMASLHWSSSSCFSKWSQLALWAVGPPLPSLSDVALDLAILELWCLLWRETVFSLQHMYPWLLFGS